MAINFANGGTQTGPAGLVQVQQWHINGVVSSAASQSAWYDFIGGGNNYGITLKTANSDIILTSSLNLDVNGGSTGQFLKWQYRIGSSGSWTDFNVATASGSRRQAHFALKTSNQNDPRHRNHRQVLETNLSAGTTLYFKLQTWLIPGAQYIKINHAQNDSDTTSNCRTTSYIFLEEFNNPT